MVSKLSSSTDSKELSLNKNTLTKWCMKINMCFLQIIMCEYDRIFRYDELANLIIVLFDELFFSEKKHNRGALGSDQFIF